MGKLTAKLSKVNAQISDLLKSTSGLTQHSNWGNIQGCELFYGRSFTGIPKWHSFIASGAQTSIPSNLNNEGVSASTFSTIQNRYLIFLFGYGNHKLKGTHTERDFGIKVALNVLNPDKVKSIDSKKLENIVVNSRIQLSKENKLEGFGFEINKDFLKHISGKPSSTSFAKMVSGGDSLTLNCDLQASNIQIKATEILNEYNSTSYKTNYSWIDNIRSMRDQVLIDDLNNLLIATFNDYLLQNRTEVLDIAMPELVDYANIDYFKIKGYRSVTEYDFIDIENLCNDIATNHISVVDFTWLNRNKIESINSTGHASYSWTIYNCIIHETIYAGDQYILSDGEWFAISTNYFASIRENIYLNYK